VVLRHKNPLHIFKKSLISSGNQQESMSVRPPLQHKALATIAEPAQFSGSKYQLTFGLVEG